MFTFLWETVSCILKSIISKELTQVEYQYETSSSDESDSDSCFEEENSEIHGRITRINKFASSGLIDDVIHFDFNCLSGSTDPQVGTEVLATIYRKGPNQMWRAKRAIIHETWERENGLSGADMRNQLNETVVIVKCVQGLLVETYDCVKFHLKDVKSEFPPKAGDILLMKTLLQDNKQLVVKSIKSMRCWKFEGKITNINKDEGTINNEVWFEYSLSACKLEKGDSVFVNAIESNQGKYSWRATSVIPVHSNPYECSPVAAVPVDNLNQLISNKVNVEITECLTFDTLSNGETKYITSWIKNCGTTAQKILRCWFETSVREPCEFSCTGVTKLEVGENSQCSSDEDVVLGPSETAYVNLVCFARDVGQTRCLVHFEFDGFTIDRYVEAKVENLILKSLMPQHPYRPQKSKFDRQKMVQSRRSGWVLPGEPSFKPCKNQPVSLGIYRIPSILWKVILDSEDILMAVPSLIEELKYSNYSNHFSTLLHLEEIQVQLEMREYDIRDICLKRRGEFLSLEVPGLAEGRPSLLLGDKVYLKVPGDDVRGPCFEGFIHEVQKNEILVKFNASFHDRYNGESYDASFECSRTNFRRCHQACSLVKEMNEQVLFPNELLEKPPMISVTLPKDTEDDRTLAIKKYYFGTKCQKLKWFHPWLNERQKLAVLRIIENRSRPLPYIVFGPPGTGKTVTLVEAILQVFLLIPYSRILVCAPSNSAADLITERLYKMNILGEVDIVRLISFQRSPDSIPSFILNLCKTGTELKSLAYSRIIVSTCVTIGSFYSLGLSKQHFTHTFIDEAGQATEPECVVSIGLVACGASGQVILAGDPMQLGPIVRSQMAKKFGLEESLLERLMKRPLYQRDEDAFASYGSYNPLLVTKLVSNYRSHLSILSFFSRTFYFDELVALAERKMVNQFENWGTLPRIKFPIIFDGIRGENYREESSPSWFNPAEIIQVVHYVSLLYELKVPPGDIGIITPYRKQVEKIRFLLQNLDIEMCKVGSVEEFQGQEKMVIIITTVRTSPNQLNSDVRHNLGFVFNPKRLNVAVSRAKALLIVVGDPSLLLQDEYWGTFVKYCEENGACSRSNMEETIFQTAD